LRKIDTEAHFYTQPYQEYLLSRTEIPREDIHKGYVRLWYAENVWEPHGGEIEDRLLDISDIRLKTMDSTGIDMQVLSLSTPGCEQFSPEEGLLWSLKTNDALAEIVSRYPDRFIGLAALAPQNPEKAALELERAVKMGLRGVKLNSHTGGNYLDDRKFLPVFETAEKLDMPLYLHPNIPCYPMIKVFDDYGFSLAGPALGFTVEAAISSMRLIYSGLLDRYPKLKIILGHMGEGLVHWIYRIDFTKKKAWMDDEIHPFNKQAPSYYLKNNFYITTSGMNSLPAFLNAHMEMGADRIMFSADYPYENSAESVKFIERIPVNNAEKEKILFRNAEKLFKINNQD